MTDSRPSPTVGPSVCPFVALAEDRDRRADTPDDGNRCYAERAPRRRDLAYQSEHCYSPEFAKCSVFLSWAARNVAEPSDVDDAAQQARSFGAEAPGDPADGTAATREAADETPPDPSPESGLFGMTEPEDPEEVQTSEQLDWVSASAWTAAPWDERAEAEADEVEEFEAEELALEQEDEDEDEEAEEATQAPKVPAALPMRKRKPPQEPIRSRGSGEWFYADPPGRDPLVSRRYGVTPPILLAVLGILLVSIMVFLVATQLGGGDESPPAAVATSSPDPNASFEVAATLAPVVTAEPSVEPQPTASPKPRFYKVKPGDSLTSIAAKFGVKPNHIQCLNGIPNKNIVVLGARYEIPPDGFSCPSGWRNATPEP